MGCLYHIINSHSPFLLKAKKARLLGQGAVEFLLNYSKKNSLKRKNKMRTNSQIFKKGTFDDALYLFNRIDPVDRKIRVGNPEVND